MPKVAHELMSVLCHPQDRSQLVQDGNRLVSVAGEDIFQIRQGIPSLVAGPPAGNRLWAWLYNRIAFGYDLGVHWGWRLAAGGAPIDRQSYLSEIEVRPGQRVLETAVGTGTNIMLLPDTGHYFGVDLSFNMLKRCRRNLGRRERKAHLVHADMQALPFLDDSFDLVFHMGGLQFAADPGLAIREMHRTSRPGSAVIVVDERYSLDRILRSARRSEPGIHKSGLDGLLQLVPLPEGNKQAYSINQGELFLLKFKKPMV